MRGRCHVIELLETFRDARDNPVLVFPFVHDDHRPEAPSAIQSYMRQLLEALAFLHDELGVMHRNIKRANVLFSASSRELRLIDFEGACAAHEGALYTRFGNNLYRAPEVAAAKAAALRPGGGGALAYNAFECILSPAGAYGTKADVFSAGVCFAELLLGCRRLLDADALEESYAAVAAAVSAGAEAGRRGESAAAALLGMLGERSAAAAARMSEPAAALLCALLAEEPGERVDAAAALCHPYFAEDAAAQDAAFWAAAETDARAAKRRRGARNRGARSRN
jgi:cell division cycle 2-like protein